MKKVVLVFLFLSFQISYSQTSNLLGYDDQGRLTYMPDSKGNVIPDYSNVGYHHSEKELPVVEVKKIIEPVAGDNLVHIQNAINELGLLPLDANGHRGTLLLKAGTYSVSSTIKIKKSGIVIRGEGDATVIVADKRSQSTLIAFEGNGNPIINQSSKTKIIDSYVPVGTRTINVAEGHSFNVGDRIMLERKPNQDWIVLLGMHDLNQTPGNKGDTNWTPEYYTIQYKRKIIGVSGNKLTIDVPVMDLIDPIYSEGFLYKYTWGGRIEEVGIENIRLESFFASQTDENHAWDGVTFNNVENGWAKKVNSYYFTYACVNILNQALKITVDNCTMQEAKGQVIGGRMYSFNTWGQQNLFKNCFAKGGRHDYVTGARVAGPNVFLNSKSIEAVQPSGPHQRWASGILFDNIDIQGHNLELANRRNSGSGHGWTSVSCMLWNSSADRLIIAELPSDHTNWSIGSEGPHAEKGCCNATGLELGYVESKNKHLNPSSLFEKQLSDRLNKGVNTFLNVSLTSPIDNYEMRVGETIALSAEASINLGTITKVHFIIDNQFYKEDNTASYSVNWAPTKPGNYSVKAIVFDENNYSVSSIGISVNVKPKVDVIKTYFTFKNVATGKYLESEETTLLASDSGAGEDKEWRLVETGSGDFFNIESKLTGKGVLRFTGGAAGTLIHTNFSGPKVDVDKIWKVVNEGNNIYTFETRNLGRYLYHNSDNTIIHSNKTDDRSKWLLEPVGVLSIDKNKDLDYLKVYPNPTNSNFTIELNNINATSFKIYNVLGKVVYKNETKSKSILLNKENLFKPGVYLIKVLDDQQKVYHSKLIIK
ncbi:Ig-like domain-containing protein [Polaribacter butkevichii]|uniref:Uncharacterized protein n=1 Tax=Polaribacter butkevichii TaxID=218490 RepID=A0A2P6CCL8_9FLAO|nr:Ig-like domain-containing protein [Polaribacter butkevichii]PQJ72654.1 hypothetical protein BTO14_05010 [Polaribacter butkevichii]